MEHNMLRPSTSEERELILMSPDYRRWRIAEYQYWDLYLNPTDQRLLGRSYAWLKTRHVDRMGLYELHPHELLELAQEIVREFDRAVKVLWPGVTTVNVEWLGNSTKHHRGHGHAHLIPRYEGKMEFCGLTFNDPDHEKRRTQERFVPSEEVLEQIRFAIKATIGR